MEEKLKLPIVKITPNNYQKFIFEIKDKLNQIGVIFNFYYFRGTDNVGNTITIGLKKENDDNFYLIELPLYYNSEDYYLCNDIDEFCEYVYKYVSNYFEFKRKQEIECNQTYYYFYITIRTQNNYKAICQKNDENKIDMIKLYNTFQNESVIIIYSQQISEEEFNFLTKTNNHEQD